MDNSKYQKVGQLSENSSFSKDSILNIPQSNNIEYSKSELNRIKVFNHIKKTEPTNIYKVAKETGLNYTTCSYIIRDLIFAGIVSEHMKFGKNNQAVKELTIPKEVQEEK